MVFQSRIVWSGPGHSPKYSIINHGTSSAAGRNNALNDFLTALEPLLSDQFSFSIDPEWRTLDDSTGQLTAVGSYGSTPTHTALVPEEPVADATQALIQYQTDGIVEGKRVRGRTFIPGTPVDVLENGNLNAAHTAALATAALNLDTGNADLVIWARPKRDANGVLIRPGSRHSVNGITVGSELAVLRRRRA